MTFLDWTPRPRNPIRPRRRCRPQVEALEQRLTPTFTPQGPVLVGGLPIAVAVGDFNGDGKPDLAVSNRGSGTVSIRLGNGTGGFTAAPDVASSAGDSVAVGDFNGDNKLDFAVTTPGNIVSIRLGNGTGGFTAAPDVTVGLGNLGSVAVGDFNADGKLDLAVTSAGQDADIVGIRLGDGGGGFTPAPAVVVVDRPRSVTVADFNGDGKPDLAVASDQSSSVSIRLGNGTGGFSAAPDLAVSQAYFVAVGDFNGDAKPDLAFGRPDAATVSIRLGDGTGGFTAAADLGANRAYSVAMGDFNGDGKLDLAVANFGSDTVSIRLGDGQGGFTAAPDVAVGYLPASVAVGDFNGDGRPDLAVANYGSGTVTVLLNTDSDRPAPPPPPPPPAPQQIAAVAFRQKGLAKVRVRDAATGTVRAILTPFRGFAGRLRLALRDLNGDGSLDLVVQAVIHGKRKQKVFDAVTLAPLPPGLA